MLHPPFSTLAEKQSQLTFSCRKPWCSVESGFWCFLFLLLVSHSFFNFFCLLVSRFMASFCWYVELRCCVSHLYPRPLPLQNGRQQVVLVFTAPEQISTFPSWVWKVEKLHPDRAASGQEVNEGCWWLMVGTGCICCKAVTGAKTLMHGKVSI